MHEAWGKMEKEAMQQGRMCKTSFQRRSWSHVWNSPKVVLMSAELRQIVGTTRDDDANLVTCAGRKCMQL
jgi:hypothetical protein